MVRYRCIADAVVEFLTQLNSERQNEQCCDFEIRCGMNKFPCHRVVLRNRTKLAADVVGSGSLECPSLISTVDLEATLQFLYLFWVDIDATNVIGLLRIARQLRMDDLRAFCEEHLAKEPMTYPNCFWLYQHAIEFDLSALRQKIASCLVDQFSSLKSDPAFLDIDLAGLQLLLTSDDLPVSDEREVLSIARQWILHKEEERAVFSEDVLRMVRLPMIRMNVREHRQLSRDPLFSSEECQHLFDIALEYTTSPATRWALQSSTTRPRPRTGLQETLIAVCFDSISLVSVWNESKTAETESRRLSTQLQVPRELSASTSVVCYDDTLYLVDSERGAVHCCDFLQNTGWRTISSQFQHRSGAECVATDGFIYLIGGQHVDQMDMKTHRWSRVADIPVPVLNPTLFFAHEKIYVIGGTYRTTTQAVGHIQILDCEKEEWSLVENVFPEPGRSMSAVGFDGIVYVLANNGMVFMLNLATFECIIVHDLAADCTMATMTVYGGQVVVYQPSTHRVIKINLRNNGVSEMQRLAHSKRRVYLFSIHMPCQMEKTTIDAASPSLVGHSPREVQRATSAPASVAPQPVTRAAAVGPMHSMPNASLPRAATTEPLPLRSPAIPAMDHWECTFCTFTNHSRIRICEMCAKSKSHSSASAQQHRGKILDKQTLSRLKKKVEKYSVGSSDKLVQLYVEAIVINDAYNDLHASIHILTNGIVEIQKRTAMLHLQVSSAEALACLIAARGYIEQAANECLAQRSEKLIKFRRYFKNASDEEAHKLLTEHEGSLEEALVHHSMYLMDNKTSAKRRLNEITVDRCRMGEENYKAAVRVTLHFMFELKEEHVNVIVDVVPDSYSSCITLQKLVNAAHQCGFDRETIRRTIRQHRWGIHRVLSRLTHNN